MSDHRGILIDRCTNREAHCVVIGMGYVGLPLAVELAESGFATTGLDIAEEKIKRLEKGESYIKDIPSSRLKPLIESKKLRATTDAAILKEADVVSICVPTPLAKTRDPDITYIQSAARQVAEHLHAGQLVCLESTTYPGTTREILLQAFERDDLKVGRDFFLAFSPERVDPGNKTYQTRNTPKVVGGVDEVSGTVAGNFYSQFIDTVVTVSSAEAAEMTKILENTFRSVNIGLVNEMAIMCDKLGIDVWEVIRAAATKPFGFMPFFPGPGLGGHCIPVDPHYLSWKLKAVNYNARFIELAGDVNSHMPNFVVFKLADTLNKYRKPLNGSKILLLGVAYKPDIDDVRESPALDILTVCRAKGAEISYHDPFVPMIRIGEESFESVELDSPVLEKSDLVLITTNHSVVDYEMVANHARIIFDTRDVMREYQPCKAEIYRL